MNIDAEAVWLAAERLAMGALTDYYSGCLIIGRESDIEHEMVAIGLAGVWPHYGQAQRPDTIRRYHYEMLVKGPSPQPKRERFIRQFVLYAQLPDSVAQAESDILYQWNALADQAKGDLVSQAEIAAETLNLPLAFFYLLEVKSTTRQHILLYQHQDIPSQVAFALIQGLLRQDSAKMN